MRGYASIAGAAQEHSETIAHPRTGESERARPAARRPNNLSTLERRRRMVRGAAGSGDAIG